jgi:hypothetical protein
VEQSMTSLVLPIGHTKPNCRNFEIAFSNTFVLIFINRFCKFLSSNFYDFSMDKICTWNLIISKPFEGYLYFFYCWRSLGLLLTLRCLYAAVACVLQDSATKQILFIKPFRIKISPLSSEQSVIPSWKSLLFLFKIQ